MSLLDAVILGALQGFTEFLPVSSSGHLELGRLLLGVDEPDLFFVIIVHVATLLATVVFYRQTLLKMVRQVLSAIGAVSSEGLGPTLAARPEAKLFLLVVVGTIPTGLIGVFFQDPLEALFGDPRLVAVMLFVTAMLLLATRFVKPGTRGIDKMTIWQALGIGVIQGLAIIPGVSRSGSTIACAMFFGIERELAARFSFMLVIPAILGALVLELAGSAAALSDTAALGVGFLTSAVVGLAALAILIPLVKKGRFYLFAFYLVPVAALAWFLT